MFNKVIIFISICLFCSKIQGQLYIGAGLSQNSKNEIVQFYRTSQISDFLADGLPSTNPLIFVQFEKRMKRNGNLNFYAKAQVLQRAVNAQIQIPKNQFSGNDYALNGFDEEINFFNVITTNVAGGCAINANMKELKASLFLGVLVNTVFKKNRVGRYNLAISPNNSKPIWLDFTKIYEEQIAIKRNKNDINVGGQVGCNLYYKKMLFSLEYNLIPVSKQGFIQTTLTNLNQLDYKLKQSNFTWL